MAITLDKTITRNSGNIINTDTNYSELNVKASGLVEDVVSHLEAELLNAEAQVNTQLTTLDNTITETLDSKNLTLQYKNDAQASAEQSASSASSASQIAIGQSTGRANIKPVLNLDFANQKRLDSKVDFTRESTATYYDGKKQVKAEENLFMYSEDLTNTTLWRVQQGLAPTSGVLAPDGTLTAFEITLNNTANAGFYYNKVLTYSHFTVTFWVKGGTFIGDLEIINGAATNQHTYTVTNEWQKVETTIQNFNSALYLVYQRTAIGGGTIHIWHPQLEQRDFATAYTPTTDKPITNYIPVLSTAQADEPRFDYDLETKECKGLLIEEQRTNLISDSTNVNYFFFGNGSLKISDKNAIAPDGTLSASIIKPNGGDIYKNLASSLSLGTYTFSAYYKGKAGTKVYILSFVGGVVNKIAHTLSGEWERLSNTFTVTNTSNFIYLSDNRGNEEVNEIKVWGLQLEQGSFPTSYIPTNGSQVTRLADSCSITGDNFSSFYNPSEGTFFADFEMTDISDSGYVISNGVTSPMFIYTNFGQSQFRIYDKITTDETYGAVADGYNKLASYYNETEMGILANGETVTPKARQDFTSFQNVSNLRLFYDNNGHIKKIAYYDKALTDTELQLMTQG